jgi:S-formylglutathione hydrolase FrmB
MSMIKKLLSLLLIISCAWYGHAGTVDTVSVMSKSMHRRIPNVIIKPENNGKQRLPVLYLLHGAGGNQNDWIRSVPELKDYVDLYQCIIVCPDGGVTSWYFDSPIDTTMRYETYVAKELITYIDQTYPTIQDKSGRAITGYSMGGHGAFYLTFRHQDVFGAAGSLSGGVDFRPFPNNWGIAKRLGSFAQYPEFWNHNTVINMLDSVRRRSVKLIFDCGVDDFFCAVNRNLHQKMLEYKIPHDYIERPGKHTWEYWRNSIKYQLVFFNEFFKKKG